jgi:hypothetical protein
MRASDRQEIQQLKSNLEEMHKNVQASEGWAIQQDELVKQLQAKVSSTENMVVDIAVFQAHALEVRKKLEIAQQSLFTKVEIIQNHFRVVNQSLDNICFRERERLLQLEPLFKKRLYHRPEKECLQFPGCLFQSRSEVI